MNKKTLIIIGLFIMCLPGAGSCEGLLAGFANSYEEVHYLIGGFCISSIVYTGVFIWQMKKYTRMIEDITKSSFILMNKYIEASKK